MGRGGWLTARAAGAVAITGLMTALIRTTVTGVNVTTVGFAYLLAVLAIASAWGFVPALAAALAATAQYNFFFLPPVGSFTIADTQNWVALAAFLITAAVASRLSARARQRAREAEWRRAEVARLYELSQALLLAGPEDEIGALEKALVRIFGFREAKIQGAGMAEIEGSFTLRSQLRVGQFAVGTLHLDGPALSVETGEAVASMVAIAVERSRLRREAARLTALREADALRNALLDAFTHDLRTPLTSIKASATALLEAQPSRSEWRELAVVIAEEADRLNDLVANQLDMALLEAGAIRPVVRPAAVETVVQAALERVPERVRVHTEVPPDLHPVLVDGPIAGRALQQIVVNALAYSPAGSTVTVVAREVPGQVRIEVRDRGSGIPAAWQHRIFEKFTRSPHARSVRPEGQGVGLTLARGLIAAAGGTLGYDANPGGGACFWVALPLADGTAVEVTE